MARAFVTGSGQFDLRPAVFASEPYTPPDFDTGTAHCCSISPVPDAQYAPDHDDFKGGQTI